MSAGRIEGAGTTHSEGEPRDAGYLTGDGNPRDGVGNTGGDAREPQPSAAPDEHRRGIATAILSVVLPGWGQAVGGPTTAGRVLVGISALWWLALVGGLVWYLVDPLGMAGWLVDPGVLGAIAALGVVAILLEVLANADLWWRWRRARRPRAPRATLVAGALVVVLGLGVVVGGVWAVRTSVTQVFASGAGLRPVDGRYNIAVLGIDEQDGYPRPDSVWVASIDAVTGQTVVFGLPREFSGFTFPDASPLAQEFPDGYTCPQSCYLNWLYPYVEDHPSLYPHSSSPGVDGMQDAITALTGLEVSATVMVTFQGLQQLVEAMGGVGVQVNRPVVLGAVSPPGGGPATFLGELEPGKYVLDGKTALLFVRSRLEADNEDRIARQTCVIKAMVSQASQLSDALRLWQVMSATPEFVRTTIPARSVVALATLAYSGAGPDLSTFVLGPPVVTSFSRPDQAALHAAVREALSSGTITTPAPEPTIGGERVQAIPYGGTAPATPDPTTPPAAPTPTYDPDVPVCQVP